MNPPLSQKRAAQYLLLGYCLFIVYGCFLPFHFNLDPNFVRWRWEILLEPLHGHLPRSSTADVASNILLFLPFGILRVWLSMARETRRPLLQIFVTAIYGLLFGIAIESGQTLSPWRSPALLDALCNGIGSFIGATAGHVMLRQLQGSPAAGYLQALARQPSLLVLLYLFVGVLVDSFYPFAVTLDISALRHNVRHSRFIPLLDISHRSWLDLLIDKVVVFAAIGYLVSGSIRPRGRRIAPWTAWLLCSALAFAIETGKLFFGGRAFRSTNVILSSAGALGGILVYARSSVPVWLKKQPEKFCLFLFVGLLVYFEVSPFVWAGWQELPARLSRIEWVPFRSYYLADPLTALFDLQKKIYLFLPLGFLCMSLGPIRRSAQPRCRALLVCFLIAVGLESLQIFLPSRVPSITDVAIFTASGWLGISIYRSLQRLCDENLAQTTEPDLD